MQKYSIVRVGDEYVVQAGEIRILKVRTQQEAARLVTEAAELLQQADPSAAKERSTSEQSRDDA